MAESYRGLTIRIGGDTSKLTKALRTTNGAISQTQQEMRKLSQALRLDPSSVEAYDMKLGYMGDHATNVAAKLSALKRTQEQLANTSISLDGSGYVGTVEKLANSTNELGSGFDNVSGMMAVAQSRLAALTPTLGAMDNEVSDLTKSMASLQQQKIAEAFNLAAGKKSVDEIAQKFANDLPAGMVRSDEAAKQLMSDIRSMSMALVFDEGKFDVSGLRTVIEKQLSGLKGVTIDSSELDKLIAKVTKFGEEYASAYAKVMQKRDEAKARQKEAVADIAQQIRDEQNALNEVIEALRDASAPTIEADIRAVEAAEAKSVAIRAQKAEEIAAEKELRKESLANIESTIEGLRKAQSYEAQLKAEIEETRKGYQTIVDDLNERIKKNDELLKQSKQLRKEASDEYTSLYSKKDEDSVRRRTELETELRALNDSVSQLESRAVELSLQDRANLELELLQIANIEKEMASNRLAYADDEIAAITAVENATRRQYDLTKRLQEQSHKLNMHYELEAKEEVSTARIKRDQQEIDAANKAYADAQAHRRSETAKTTAQEKRLWKETAEHVAARKEAVESAERSIREQIEQTTSKGDEIAARLKSQYDVLNEAGNEEAGTLPEEQRVEVLKRCEKAAQEVMNERVANTKKRNKEVKSLEEELARVHASANGKSVDSEVDYTKRIEEESKRREQVIKASIARVTAIQAEARTANEDEVMSATVKLRQDRDSVRVQENKLVEESLERQNELAEKFDATLDESSVHSREIASITDEARKLTEDTIKGLSKFGPEVKGLAGTIFSRDNGNNSFAEIEEVIDSISEQLGLSALQANNFKAAVKRLKDEFHSADNDVKQLLQVEKFQDLIVEMTKSQAAVKSLSKAMADMHVPSDLMRGMAVLNANVDELDAAYKALVSTAGGLDAAYKAEPGNVDVATQAMNAYNAAAIVASEQASKMQERLRAFDPSKIEGVTDATKSAAQQLFDASVAAEKADQEYRELAGQLQFLQGELERLNSVQPETVSTDANAALEARKAYDKAQSELDVVNNQITVTKQRLEEAAAASEEATRALDGAKMRKEYEEASAGAVSYAANAKRAAESARDAFVQRSLAVTFGDTSAIDRLKAQLGSLMSSAEAFGNAMALDPDNIELASARVDRLAAAEEVAANRMAEIQTAMSKVDTSKVSELRERYGSVSEAVAHLRELTDSMADVPNYLSGIKDRLFDPNASFKDYELEHMPESIRKAREEVIELASQGRTAFGMLADAESALRFEELSQELASARSEFEKIARMNIGDAIKASLRGAFGDTSDIAKALDDAMRSATGRIGSFDGALEFDSKSIELADSRMRALLDALASGKREADTLRAAMSGIDSSAVEEMRATYGSVDESVSKTGKAVDDLVRKLADAKAAQKSAVGTDEYEAAAERVNKLSSELDEAEKAAAKAAQYERWQAYEERLAQVDAALKKLRKSSEDVAAANVEALSSNYGSGMFTEVTERVAVFDDAISKAEARYKQYVEAVKDDPSNKLFREEKAKAFAEAVDLASQKSNYLKEVIGQFDQSKIESLKSQFGSLSKAVSEGKTELKATEKEIEDLKRKVEDFAAANGKSAEWVRQFVDAKSKIDDIPPSLAPVRQRLEELWKTQDAQQMQVAIASVCEKLEEMGVDAETAAARINQAFENAGKGRFDDAAFQQALERVSQLAEQAGQKIVESANTIDSAYRDMRKTVVGAESDFQKLREAAIDFSQTQAVSADTILSIEALGGQLGITAEHLQNFGENISAVTIATDISAEDAALQFGQLANIMSDLDGSDFQPLSDALVRLGNTTATTESAIMNVAQRMSSVANVTNMTTPQLLAWSAAIASTGQRSESAATAINNTITGIGKAVTAGGETLNQFATIANMTADEFRNAWANSSSEALEAFVKGLGSLTDDSTAAIKALDDVGISSVRQETALLALSQTIGSIDEAMENAEAAWNGGGDAAREAARKSEGFSGALSIMQNNASNLAASLGDSLVPAMNLISNCLKLVTDLLSSLPAPVRGAIVAVGGLGTAFATVYPMVQQLKKGWGEMVAEMASAPGMVNGLKSSMIEAGHALAVVVDALKSTPGLMAQAAAGSEGLTGALAAMGVGASSAAAGFTALMTAIWPLLAVTAVVAAVGAIVEEFNEWREHVALVEDATRTFDGVMSESKASVDGYAESLRNMSMSADEVRESHDTFLQSQADFRNGLGGAFAELEKNSVEVGFYADTIKDLAGKCDGSTVSLQQLKDAVTNYNSVTGASVQIVDEATGALNIHGDALDRVTEAYLANAEASAYIETYTDAVKNRVAAEIELEASQDRLKSQQEELNRLQQESGLFTYENNAAMGELIESNRALEEGVRENEDALTSAKDIESTAKEALDDYKDAADDARSKLDEYGAALVSAGMDTSEFSSLTDDEKRALDEIQAALAAAGTSLSNYGALNASQLSQIAAAWRNGANDIVSIINTIKSVTADAGAGATVSSGKQDDSAVREFKNQQEAAYTQAKREADDYYSREKKARDDAYDNEKRRLDKEYNNHKKTLDNEYQDRKSELDKEYNAAKKSSDQYLKDFKAALDKQVSDHKAATESRLKDLEKEYEAKKKLLELEYNDYDSELSDRIQAIKDEQAAEDEALKQRERKEKLAELGKAVDAARTSKARKEAEKELSDYKEQLAREDIKAQRDAQIDALEEQRKNLKDQLTERQQHLKDTYDTAVEEYKAETDAELEILKAANDAKYEQEKELETSKLEMRKEANDATLQMMKDTNDAILADEKEANELYLKGIKDRNEQELLEIKRDNEDKLANLKNQQERELAAFKEGGQAAVDALNGVKKEADETSESVQKSMANMQESTTKNLWEMPKGMAEAMKVGTTVMNGVLGAAAAPLAESASMVMRAVTDPFADMELIERAYGQAGVNGLVSGFSDETAVTALQYVAERLASAGTDPMRVMEELNRIAGAGSAWAVANGLSDEQANAAVAEASRRIADANGDVLSGMAILDEIYGKDAVVAIANGMSSRDALSDVQKATGVIMESTLDPFSKMGLLMRVHGANAVVEAANGMAEKGDISSELAAKIAEGAAKSLDSYKEWSKTSGRNLSINFANGVGGSDAVTSVTNAALSIARIAASYLHHSTPDKGPLKDDDKWGGELVMNFVRSMGSKSGLLERESIGLANAMASGFAVDARSINADFTQSLIDSMRSREHDLYEQSKRMAEMVERGFDPRLTLDAAYEAIDRIDAGEIRRQQVIASSQSVDNSTYAPVINISIPEVVVREEADIDKLSQQIALRVQRSINSRIG